MKLPGRVGQVLKRLAVLLLVVFMYSVYIAIGASLWLWLLGAAF